jgi:DNA-binding beta-propeller fold protein YncE
MPAVRKSLVVIATLLIAVTGVVATPSPSSAAPPNGTVLTLTWEDAQLFAVDPTDAATTLIGAGAFTSMTGISWDEITGTLYAVDYDFSPASLYTIDPDTGAGTLVGSMGLDEPTGLDVEPGTGTLFLVYDDDGGSMLATVDPVTAAVTDIGPTLDGDLAIRMSGIGFDPTDGTLYGFGYDDNLYEIDPTTGAMTLLHAEVFEGYGVAFDCEGNLLASDSETDGQLVSIDTETGTVTPIGSMDLDGDFSENLTVVCGVVPPETTTTTTTAAPTTTTTAVAAAVVTPRFTG